jgi:hypothetical protein
VQVQPQSHPLPGARECPRAKSTMTMDAMKTPSQMPDRRAERAPHCALLLPIDASELDLFEEMCG